MKKGITYQLLILTLWALLLGKEGEMLRYVISFKKDKCVILSALASRYKFTWSEGSSVTLFNINPKNLYSSLACLIESRKINYFSFIVQLHCVF